MLLFLPPRAVPPRLVRAAPPPPLFLLLGDQFRRRTEVHGTSLFSFFPPHPKAKVSRRADKVCPFFFFFFKSSDVRGVRASFLSPPSSPGADGRVWLTEFFLSPLFPGPRSPAPTTVFALHTETKNTALTFPSSSLSPLRFRAELFDPRSHQGGIPNVLFFPPPLFGTTSKKEKYAIDLSFSSPSSNPCAPGERNSFPLPCFFSSPPRLFAPKELQPASFPSFSLFWRRRKKNFSLGAE